MVRDAVPSESLEAHPDALLIARLTAGHAAAYRELFRQHSDEVYRLARRFVTSDADAEEVTQEVFIAAHQSIGRFRGHSRLRTWLFRITVNRALKRRRSRRSGEQADAGLSGGARQGPAGQGYACHRGGQARYIARDIACYVTCCDDRQRQPIRTGCGRSCTGAGRGAGTDGGECLQRRGLRRHLSFVP